MSQKQKQNKGEKEGERRRAIKDQIDKRRKDNRTLSQKKRKGAEKNFNKRQ
jgi:hypothetical protein